MDNNSCLSRRQFLRRTAATAATLALSPTLRVPATEAGKFAPPIALFDKVLHQVNLSLEDSAALAEEVGLDGVDCAVRSNDQIEPARVQDDLPRYAELLRKRGCKLLLLTTAILNPTAPHVRDVLDTARKLNVRHYRLASTKWNKDRPADEQLAELKRQLRDLVALNQELGLCALLQNHSPGTPGGYLHGELNNMYELVRDLPSAQIGVAFDLGHALVVHGDDWKSHFEKLKPHVRVGYIKDADRKRGFLAFGEGEFGRTGFFTRLKQMHYAAPLSLHIEYNWAKGGEKNRETLAQALRESLGVLRKWLAAA